MPSFGRRASTIGADRADDPAQSPDHTVEVAQARALAEEAEAEAAEAEAAAAAARARTRALRLRKRAEAFEAVVPNNDTARSHESASKDAEATTDTETAGVIGPEPETTTGAVIGEIPTGERDDEVEKRDKNPAWSPRRWRVRGMLKIAPAALVISCTIASLTAGVYMIWQQGQVVRHQQQNAEYAEAAKQRVVTLMSMDSKKAKEDVQRIIDTSTGKFRDDFKSHANDFVTVAQDSKVMTDVKVNATAVESMTDESAVVLVSATTHVTNSTGAKEEPRAWRLSVNLQRDGGQIKMSKVEFVP